MRPQAEPAEISAQALAQARDLGADAAQVAVSREVGQEVEVRLGELETLEHTHDQQLSVQVYFGHRAGSASSTDLRPEACARTVEAACEIARCTEEDPAHGLPERDWLARDYPDLDLAHPWMPDVEEASRIARACEDAARADDRIVASDGARLSTSTRESLLANSLGFCGDFARSCHSLSCCVVGQEGDTRERDYWYHTDCDAQALQSPDEIGRRAAERTLRRLGARGLSSRFAPVLFEAPVAASLLGHFVAAASGPALYQKASFLLDSLEQEVWADHVRVVEQPHVARSISSAPFDREGVATRERTLVEDGVLRGWFLGTYSARRLGLESTGNAGGVRNLMLRSSLEEPDFAALLRKMDQGLLVTELMGQGANTVTGDYSRGAAGFWVEGGRIAYPVHEITIAGNLRDLYRGLVAVGSDRDRRGSLQTGSLLVEGMQVAGA